MVLTMRWTMPFVTAALLGLPLPTSADSPAQELAHAEATWKAHKPSAYEFTVDVQCYCPLADAAPTFRVRNGAAAPVRPLDARVRRTYDDFSTVEKLFAVLRRHLARSPFKVAIQYDKTLGYPVSAEIDGRQDVTDDGLSFHVTGFRAVQAREPAASTR